MSLIGTLEQFNLSTVLQRVERHEKTGLLVLKNQGSQWIEFYLHEGRLLCVGPIRTNASLGERLLQDGVISPIVLRETLLVLGNNNPVESLMARTLMELNYVSRDELRSWAIQKAIDVLNVVLSWPSGEVYFEEDTLPPSDRLLVSMSISSLLESTSPRSPSQSSIPVSESPQATPPPPISQALNPIYPDGASEPPATPTPDVSRMPTLMSASQFIDDTAFSVSSLMDPFSSVESPLPMSESFAPLQVDNQAASSMSPFPGADMSADVADFPSFFSDGDAIEPSSVSAPLHPVPVLQPVPPKRIDTSFMQPAMVLIPADLSAYRDQNPQVQLTPDEWQILTLIDGRNSLQMICQLLGAPGDVVCTIVGELIAVGLVYISIPGSQQIQEISTVSRELAASGMANGYVAPGYVSATASPWSVSLPTVASPPVVPASPSPMVPVPTEAQWGNGENGAAFIPGRGWVMNPQPMQNPYQANNIQPGAYAPAGTGY